MNRLSTAQRTTILNLLVEGVSLRAIARTTNTSINTVTRLLVDAGNACAEYHDQAVRHVRAKRVQVDEIWTFTYAKEKNVPMATAAPEGAGDTWTWTALDADSKLIVSWLIGPRDAGSAYTMMHDLADRIATRVQLTSDGLRLYIDAVDDAFGTEIDYAQLIKLYGAPREPESRYSPATCTGTKRRTITGHPDPRHISTSYVERQNLNIRMGIPTVHTAHERLWKEAREPGPCVRALPRVLQLLPDPQDVADVARDGGWRDGYAAGCGVDCWADRCADTSHEEARAGSRDEVSS